MINQNKIPKEISETSRYVCFSEEDMRRREATDNIITGLVAGGLIVAVFSLFFLFAGGY